jgi:hypothetical protein
MTEDEFIAYWLPACVNLYGADPKLGGQQDIYDKLDSLLKIDEYKLYCERMRHEDTQMTPDVFKKVRLLASPLWRAVLIANNLEEKVHAQNQPTRAFPHGGSGGFDDE